jgi:hypothetical protein
MTPHKSECPAVTGQNADQNIRTFNCATGTKPRKAESSNLESLENADPLSTGRSTVQRLYCYCGGPGGRPGMQPTCVACNSFDRIRAGADKRLLKPSKEGSDREH